MSVLTPLAVENAAVLRALDAGGFGTVADLARKQGRDAANFRKTLKALERDGLVVVDADGPHPQPILSDAGREALAALARAENPPPQGGEARRIDNDLSIAGSNDRGAVEGVAALLHAQIKPDPENPRKHFDEESLAELADSIAQDGLLENLVVRAARTGDAVFLGENWTDERPTHRLIAGERRWRAIQLLIADGRWPADRPVVCNVKDIDDAAHRRIALVENLQRKDLRPIDEAEGLKALMDLTGAGTADVAKEIGFTQRFVQQRLQLLELPAAKREALNEGGLTIEDARRWIAARPKPIEGLTPEQLLVVLETAWALAKSSSGWWSTTKCDWPARHDRCATETIKSPSGGDQTLIKVTRGQVWQDDKRSEVRLTEAAFNHVIAITNADGQLVRSLIEPHLRKARLAVLPGNNPLASDYDPKAFQKVDELFKAKRYITPWLNGPFEVDPETREAAEARKAEQDSAAAERAEELARRKAEDEARAAKIEAAEVMALAVLRGFQARAWAAADLKQVFAEFGAPLPWTWRDDPTATHAWNSDEGMLDAEGRPLDEFGGLPPALLRLVMAALNAAVDEPPNVTIPPDPEDGDDGEDSPEDDDDTDHVAFLDDDEAEPAAADEPLPDYLTRLAGPAPADVQP